MSDVVSMESLVKKLEQLKAEMDAGHLKHGEYDQRLARMIGELRDLKVDADRAKMKSTLEEVLRRGVITPAVKAHLEKRLGLA
jgi:hypothetical protein